MDCKGMLKSVTKDWITGRFLLTFEVDSDVSSDINKLADKMLTLAVKVYRKKRSLDANAYYWQLITKLAEASGISKNRAHNLMLRRYGKLEEVDGHLIYMLLCQMMMREKTRPWRQRHTTSSQPARLRLPVTEPHFAHTSCCEGPVLTIQMR